jgi:hypothetical protein
MPTFARVRPMRASSIFTVALFGLFALAACSGDGGEPGTPTNPVETCAKAGDVCRIDDSRLGVCVEGCDPKNEGCEHACFTCAPQH